MTSVQSDVELTVPKKEISLLLPFYGKFSDVLQKRLVSLFKVTYPQVDLKIKFRTTLRLAHLFNFKDKIPLRFRAFVVYGVHCTNCDSFYVGKTKRHMATRYREHCNPKRPTAVTTHIMTENHDFSLDDMTILDTSNYRTDEELYIKETLVIRELKPDLNEHVSSYPLELF